MKKILGYTCLGVIALTVVFAAIMGIIETRRYDNDGAISGGVDAPVLTATPLETVSMGLYNGKSFDKDGFIIVSQSDWNTNIKVDAALADEAKLEREAAVAIYKKDHIVGEATTISKSAMTKRVLKYLDLQIDEVINADRDEEIRHENAVYAAITDPNATQTAAHEAAIQTAKDNAVKEIADIEFSKKAIKNARSESRDGAFAAGWQAFIAHFQFLGLGGVMVALGIASYIFLKKEEEVKKSAK